MSEFEDGAPISLVFTPPKFRRFGYGKIITAFLTKKLLEGPYVKRNLFTDLTNLTSDKIIKRSVTITLEIVRAFVYLII